MHLKNSASVNVGDPVTKGEQIGIEGTTGHSTGIHLHVEMQDLNRWNNVWHWSYVKSDYLDPTQYMGIDNIDETSWIYDGTPVPPTPTEKEKSAINILLMKKVEMNRRKNRNINIM
jgi:murein DD-endopeptidase MepM/ murein hydrolase activator NlpD